jgi:hypothetical protein
MENLDQIKKVGEALHRMPIYNQKLVDKYMKPKQLIGTKKPKHHDEECYAWQNELIFSMSDI